MEYFKNYGRMTIGSWSEANKLGNGTYVKSDRFNAGGHSWRIAFYPHGRLAGTTASMSVFLLLDNDDKAAAAAASADEDVVHVKFRFIMQELYDRSPVFMSATVSAALSRRSNAHGFERFVLRDDFEKTVLSKRDRFEIQCGLTVFPVGSKQPAAVQMRSGQTDPPLVVQTPPPPPASPEPSLVGAPPSAPPPTPTPTPSDVRAMVPPVAASPKPSVVNLVMATPPPESTSPAPSVTMLSAPPPSVQQEQLVAGVSGSPASGLAEQKAVRAPPLSGLSADLARLLATKEGADVALEVRGKVFAAHKVVLAARSPVFMEELFGPAKEEDTGYVRFIPDMSPEAFQAMLHYLYTDTLPPELAMTSAEKGDVILQDLLAAADRYELKDLKLRCCAILLS